MICKKKTPFKYLERILDLYNFLSTYFGLMDQKMARSQKLECVATKINIFWWYARKIALLLWKPWKKGILWYSGVPKSFRSTTPLNGLRQSSYFKNQITIYIPIERWSKIKNSSGGKISRALDIYGVFGPFLALFCPYFGPNGSKPDFLYFFYF